MSQKSTSALEGITLQMAGELFRGEVPPHGCTEHGRASYIHALEDFVFAVTLFDCFSASRKTEEDPGQMLIQRFDNFFQAIENSSQVPAKDILLPSNPMYSIVVADLRQLNESLNSAGPHWKSYILRESHTYLGDNSSLWSEKPEFKKPFFQDTSLEGHIPQKFANQLVDHVNKFANPVEAPQLTLQKFVRRSVLTHVGILNWYEYCRSVSPVPGLVSLPCPTRASIIHHRAKTATSRIQSGIVPYVLELALEGVRTPGQFLDRIYDLRDLSNPLGPIRKMLADVLVPLQDGPFGNDEKADEKARNLLELIAKEAERLRNAGPKPDSINIHANFSGVTIAAGTKLIEETFNRTWRPTKYLLRGLMTSSRDVVNERIDLKLKKLFPQLYSVPADQ